MAFPSTVTTVIPQVQEGELWEGASTILSTTNFQSGLLIGRFAQIISGVLSNLDGTTSPNIAGVVARRVIDSVENPGVVGTSLPYYLPEPNQIYARQGMITVRLAASSGTPVQFGQVYAINASGNADNGNVSTTSTNAVQVNAEFIQQIQSGIWLIRLK